jgi:hypothetical protein
MAWKVSKNLSGIYPIFSDQLKQAAAKLARDELQARLSRIF